MWQYINYETELYHHGVKGMKWGVRHDRPRKSRKRKALYKSSDIAEKIKSGGNFEIRKGRPLFRFAGSPNEDDSTRKYVSLETDSQTYDEIFGDIRKDQYAVKFSPKKDIRVASGAEVVKTILKHQGNKRAYNISKEIKSKMGKNEVKKILEKNKIDPQKFLEESTDLKNYTKNNKAVLKDLRNRKFDAAVDVYDIWRSSLAKTPLILLNPEKSKIGRKYVKKIWEGNKGVTTEGNEFWDEIDLLQFGRKIR